MERVDGAQARLKHLDVAVMLTVGVCGKGGWGSGEIETINTLTTTKEPSCGKGGWGSGEIETI